ALPATTQPGPHRGECSRRKPGVSSSEGHTRTIGRRPPGNRRRVGIVTVGMGAVDRFRPKRWPAANRSGNAGRRPARLSPCTRTRRSSAERGGGGVHVNVVRAGGLFAGAAVFVVAVGWLWNAEAGGQFA